MPSAEDLFDQLDELVQRCLDGEDVSPDLALLPEEAQAEFAAMLEAQGGQLHPAKGASQEPAAPRPSGGGSPVVAKFLESFWQDRSEGLSHDLAHYLKQHPGDVEGIAHCYFALAAQSGSTETSGSQRQQIGTYSISEVMGRGGQATVYLAQDHKLQRTVALKVFEGANAIGKRALERFKREARAVSKVSHPCIGKIYEADVIDGLPYIAMELVSGESMAREIDGRRGEGSGDSPRELKRETEERLSVLSQIAEALAAAHRVGVIHRDLKPANIMLREDGSPVLLDFGLAKIEDDDVAGITGTLDLLGTPAYIAPERLQNPTGQASRLEDIYALGVTAFEYLSGERPFQAPTVEELYRKKLRGDSTAMETLLPGVSKDLAVVVRTAMELDPARRYQNAQDFAADLRRIVAREPVSVRPLGSTVKIMRWYRRNAVVATLALLILCSLSAFSYLTWRKNKNIEALRAEAVERGDALSKSLDEVLELSDVKRVEDLIQDSETLWPIAAETIPRMENWLQRAQDLKTRGDRHRAALLELQRGQRPITDADIKKALPIEFRRFQELKERVMEHRAGKTGLDEKAIEAAVAAEELLESKSTQDYLKRVEDMRATSYKTATDSWRAELLARLEKQLVILGDEKHGLLYSIQERAKLARRIRNVTITERDLDWKKAAQELKKDPRFEGFELQPMAGFVPLGADPQSGLQEFYHYVSCGLDAIPGRDEKGQLPELRHEDGLIMVLLPGGDFEMGAIKDPNDENFDRYATDGESPRHALHLAPYLISKYECSQGAWLRLSGKNPSAYKPGSMVRGHEIVDLLHPVEFINWYDARKVLKRFELELPTEAQWEFAARAGKENIWSFGNDPMMGAGRINIVDKSLGELAGPQVIERSGIGSHDDGWALHGPVNLYEPNAYGLYEMHGNVYEWCLDSYATYKFAVREDDGLRLGSINDNDMRMFRGGAYGYSVFEARSTARSGTEAASPNEVVGLRPVFNIKAEGSAP